jgi:hypothetical protein
MRITEQTTIGELVPEGYELDNAKNKLDNFSNEKVVWGSQESGYVIYIYVKNKEEKDFEWYVNSYTQKEHNLIVPKLYSDPVCWRWKERIGLFKFICDDKDLKFHEALFGLHQIPTSTSCKIIKELCPEGFINSIIYGVSNNEVEVCSHEWTRPIINADNYQCSKCGIWKEQTDC